MTRVKFPKDFWECFGGPIADRRVPSYDPRTNCGANFGSSSLFVSKVANMITTIRAKNWAELTFAKTSGTVIRDRERNWPIADRTHLLHSRGNFHRLPLFYVRAYARKNYATVDVLIQL